MKEAVSFGLEVYLLGFIAFLLIAVVLMLRKVIALLTALSAFQEGQAQTTSAGATDFQASTLDTDCTEEELAAIMAALTQILPDQKLNAVKLKAAQ